MEVIPAIDIIEGKCVRLYQGDYAQKTVFSDDPVGMAARWVETGARRLHVVDLDGAKEGVPVNIDLVGRIASSVAIPVQLGGGIGTIDAARDALSRGVDRVLIGTAAVERRELVAELADEIGAEALVVSVDAKDGEVMARGWTRETKLSASEMIGQMEAMGVARFVYTDITRDGTLTGPNFPSIENIARGTSLGMLVAGGVSSIDHLVRLSAIGVEAAIVGTAIYTGDIDLAQAIANLDGLNTDSN